MVPKPLPPGGELAAIWASNLSHPKGSIREYKDTLATIYGKMHADTITDPKLKVH